MIRFLLFQLAIIVVLQVLSFHGLRIVRADESQKCAPTVCSVPVVAGKNLTIGVRFPFGVTEGCGASKDFLLSGCNTTTTGQSGQLLNWNGFQNFYKDYSTKQTPPFVFNVIYQNTSMTPALTPIPIPTTSTTINITWNKAVFETGANETCAVNISNNITQYFTDAEIDLSNSSLSISNTTSVLLFKCTKDPKNTSTSTFNSGSNLCNQYKKDCGLKDLSCTEWKPSTQININKTMNDNNCRYFQVMVSKGTQPDNIVLKAGIIQLRWNMTSDDCDHCLGSSGGCGYVDNNSSTPTFHCVCSANNITSNGICQNPATSPASSKVTDNISSSNKKTPTPIIVLSAAASVVAVFLVLVCLFFINRRQRSKKPYSTERSIPSTALSNKIWTERANLLSRKFGPVLVKEFSYEELIRATNDFAETNCIGDGGFGAVYIGVMKDGSRVAVKRLYHDNFRRMDQFYNEMKILSTLKHPNLVKLHGFCCEHDKDLLLVFEYVENGTVSDQLHGKGSKSTMPWLVRLKIAYQTAGALHYLHNSESSPIYHRDVKTTNILLDDDYNVKLADFGLSRLVPVEVTHVSTAPQGTPGYVDPEYHTCYQLTDKSDVYSFGVVLMELVSAKLAVDMTRSKKEINLSSLALAKITAQSQHELIDPYLEIEKHPEIEKSVKAVIELAFRCLQPEKDDRPNMKEVYETLTQIWNEYRGHQESDTLKSNSGPGFQESKSVDTFFDPYNSKSDLSVAPSPADETCKLIKVKSEVNSADSSVWTNSNQSNSF